jgi:hypothetical protein
VARGHQAESAGCAGGVAEINGITTRAFCGSATAQADVGGQTWSWTQGQCETLSRYFTVNIGRIIMDTGAAANQLKKQYDYFGTTFSAIADGTYTGSIAGNYQGKDILTTGTTITLSDGMKKGTFTGTNLDDNIPVSGSFSC